MEVLGVRLLGFDSATGHRLFVSAAFIATALLVRLVVTAITAGVTRDGRHARAAFWTGQAASIVVTGLVIVALVSIWVGQAGELATAAGLVGAGVAFALQKVITAFAGYLVILRGRTFTVGDRITMGGVRGDVISLAFLQTRIMEIGEPPAAQSESNPIWIRARQYTGRVVTVTNDKVFDEPVYNYTAEFPFIWEEIKIPLAYDADRRRAEAILLECAGRVTASFQRESEPRRLAMERKYFISLDGMTPRVYYHITDNWVELNLRFITGVRGTRDLKDEVSREILDRFDDAHITIASATYDVVGFPPVRLEGPVAERLAGALETTAAHSRS